MHEILEKMDIVYLKSSHFIVISSQLIEFAKHSNNLVRGNFISYFMKVLSYINYHDFQGHLDSFLHILLTENC
jgi:hypothetical protein